MSKYVRRNGEEMLVHIRLEEGLHRALKKKAVELEVSMTHLVCSILRWELRNTVPELYARYIKEEGGL